MRVTRAVLAVTVLITMVVTIVIAAPNACPTLRTDQTASIAAFDDDGDMLATFEPPTLELVAVVVPRVRTVPLHEVRSPIEPGRTVLVDAPKTSPPAWQS
ncbi:MAG TPA: hypothetical protein VFQ53_23965 [Kofleriaceae bacterium]|nr:hypothetical protein [Kofleriaceae bacterium]